MKKIIILSFFLSYSFHNFSFSQYLVLAKNSASEYSIWESTPCEASEIFRTYFTKITGARLKKATDTLGPRIMFSIISNQNPLYTKLDEDGFRISTSGKKLYFDAKTKAGLNNAVLTFLEKYAGCRYFTEDCKIIPTKETFSICPISIIENPTFSFRVVYYNQAFQKDYAAWHKLENATRDGKKHLNNISDSWGLWVHTLHRLMPPINYFEKHPEYFALRNGIRMPDQPCLSNPEVAKIVTASLKAEIAKNPTAKYWSVSQMDNYNYCQCPLCRATDSIEGSPSGSVIRFVNEIAKNFPDKIISTLAYQYSRQAPHITKPASNVNIMLCTIECDRSKPIAADFSSGSFSDDLKSWSKISNNILIWDYVINFSHIEAPFPNFHVLQPNAEFFAANGTTGIFEQGWANAGGEFNELRCYLLSKLVWNSSVKTDSLMNEFIPAFYGKAGPFIRKYIDLITNTLRKSGHALTLYEPPGNHISDFLTPANIETSFSLFEKALEAVKGDKIFESRVEQAFQPVRYAWLETAKAQPFTSAWILEPDSLGGWKVKERAKTILNDFYQGVKKYGPPTLHETRITPEEYKATTEQYFNNAYSSHLAKGKKIRYRTESSMQYPANGPGTLVDGVRATTDYQNLWLGWWGEDAIATIDFEKETTFKSVEIGCLDMNESWIIAPDSIFISTSDDGYNFTPVASYANPQSGKKIDMQILNFKIILPADKNIRARYIRVHISNYGKIPAWRGVESDSWLFIDEIIVR